MLIGERVSIWWRSNFETIMHPYFPPQMTKPKGSFHDSCYVYVGRGIEQ